MMHHDDFFTPENIDRQIDQASQQRDADRADVEMLAYLHSYYRAETSRQQEMLGRIWSRIAPAVAPLHDEHEVENNNCLRDRPVPSSSMTPGRSQQLPTEDLSGVPESSRPAVSRDGSQRA